MIVVTGASGQLGRMIVEQLLLLMPAAQIGASVRDPEKAQELAQRGVRVRRGDFTDPDSLLSAFEGATQVLLVSSNASAYGGDPIAQHRTALDAARASGVGRIVYTSHMGASPTSAFPPMRDHAATEEMLRSCGMVWTSLRNGFYASSGIQLMGKAPETGVINAPADGKVSWTTHANLAEAAAYVLTHEGEFDGPTPPLTASEALDLADLAALASDVLGRPVRREVQPDGDAQAGMAARGLPPHVVDIVLGLYRASRVGEFATVDPTLSRLLGHSPMPMRESLKASLSA